MQSLSRGNHLRDIAGDSVELIKLITPRNLYSDGRTALLKLSAMMEHAYKTDILPTVLSGPLLPKIDFFFDRLFVPCKQKELVDKRNSLNHLKQENAAKQDEFP